MRNHTTVTGPREHQPADLLAFIASRSPVPHHERCHRGGHQPDHHEGHDVAGDVEERHQRRRGIGVRDAVVQGVAVVGALERERRSTTGRPRCRSPRRPAASAVRGGGRRGTGERGYVRSKTKIGTHAQFRIPLGERRPRRPGTRGRGPVGVLLQHREDARGSEPHREGTATRSRSAADGAPRSARRPRSRRTPGARTGRRAGRARARRAGTRSSRRTPLARRSRSPMRACESFARSWRSPDRERAGNGGARPGRRSHAQRTPERRKAVRHPLQSRAVAGVPRVEPAPVVGHLESEIRRSSGTAGPPRTTRPRTSRCCSAPPASRSRPSPRSPGGTGRSRRPRP